MFKHPVNPNSDFKVRSEYVCDLPHEISAEKLAELSDWFDQELAALNEKYADFVTHRSVTNDYRESMGR